MINVILTMEGFVMSPKTEVKMEERFHLSIWIGDFDFRFWIGLDLDLPQSPFEGIGAD